MELKTLKELTDLGEKEFEKAEGDDLDSSKLPSFIWIPEFISLAGSTMYERENNREPGDVDMIIRAEEDNGEFKVELDAGLRLKVDRVMADLLGGETSWTGAMTGANWRYKPLWDLALVPHEPDEIRDINEPEFAERFYKEHSLSQCMECEEAPEFEILWAEGRAHAWFCRKHTYEFIREKITEKLERGKRKTDIVWVKECEGEAHRDPTENQNSNVQEALTEEIDMESITKERLNSPSFAHKAVYGETKWLSGRTGGAEHECDGVKVDEHIKCEWIRELNGIAGIELRASCEGHSEERVAYIVFRLKGEDKDQAKEVSTALSRQPKLYSLSDIGMEGKPRIVVAGKTYYGQEDWEGWWNSLSEKIENALGETITKLNLEEFRQEGIDDDLKNPKQRWKQLQADLRYLGNSGYPKLSAGDKWGGWTLEDIFKYFAKIVDVLRSIYFPVAPPKIGDEKFDSSYWKCYREAQKYMKTKPPKDDEIKLWNAKREEVLRKFEKFVEIFDISKSEDEHIVCGIVYSPDEEDAQGDQASPEEIRKAAYDFMENVQKFGTNHVSDSIKWAFGKNPLARVLENYIAPCDLTIEGEQVRKGSWVLITRILSEALWRKIKSREITGYSMAGKATA